MSRLKRDRAKKHLLDLLGIANDEEFCRMVWATRELQTRGGSAYTRVFSEVPLEAHTTDLSKGQYAFPWMLETLVNELLSTPKNLQRFDRPRRQLKCDVWGTIPVLLNNLRRWEDGEDELFLNSNNIMDVIDRIGHQQFQWQRGDLNLPSFYRSARLYGGEKASAQLQTLGFSLNTLSAMGVAIWGGLARGPYVRSVLDLKPLGISDAEQVAAMKRISAPIEEMRRQASNMRVGRRHPAYAQSVLRRFPAINGMLNNDHILVPLPELVLSRVTSGVYYDVVGGGKEVHTEIGRAFEAYALDLLSRTLPSVNFSAEYKYKFRKNNVDSPDIIGRTGKDVRLVIECKATKLTFEGKFGDGDIAENRGFDEVAKGAYQIWKYYAHCRLGLTNATAAPNAVGVVLTLDSWVQISFSLKEKLLVRAKEMAAEKSSEIEECDMCDIAFYPVENMEYLVLHRNDDAVLEQIAVAASADLARNVPAAGGGDLQIPKPYPFKADIGRALPWWNTVGTARDSGA